MNANTFPPSTQKLLDNQGALTNMVRRIAIEAGAITLKYFEGEKDMEAEKKGDNSPVTLADQEAEACIEKRLSEIAPGIPMIGEESVAAGKAPSLEGHEYSWRVDALDGTKGFIRGEPHYTVNIALIKGNAPVLGVVYAPALGELYAGHGPDTAIMWREDTDKEKPIKIRELPKEGLSVVASVHHADMSKIEKFLQGYKVAKVVRRNSSLKICVIAAGKADIYPRFGPTCEWDTAAGDAVLRAAGGMITDLDGKPLVYGGSNPKWLNPEFIASSFAWFDVAED